MDEQAANPFDTRAPEYARVRPAYPDEVVTRLVDAARASAADTRATGAEGGGAPRRPVCVDLGAGTGKMTLLLAARGLAVHAVEPSAAMRSELAAALSDTAPTGTDTEPAPGQGSGGPTTTPLTGEAPAPTSTPGARAGLVHVHPASAEATGLPDGCADLVVAAQAWHWFDPARATREAARILRPGGTLALVWNQMDVSLPWVHRLTRIMRSGDVHRPGDVPDLGPDFTPPTLVMPTWEDHLTTDEVMALGTTRSSYLRSSAEGRARMQANLDWYLHEHLGHARGATVTLPYATLLWTARRL